MHKENWLFFSVCCMLYSKRGHRVAVAVFIFSVMFLIVGMRNTVSNGAQ